MIMERDILLGGWNVVEQEGDDCYALSLRVI